MSKLGVWQFGGIGLAVIGILAAVFEPLPSSDLVAVLLAVLGGFAIGRDWQSE